MDSVKINTVLEVTTRAAIPTDSIKVNTVLTVFDLVKQDIETFFWFTIHLSFYFYLIFC